jgi:hypothetical protein
MRFGNWRGVNATWRDIFSAEGCWRERFMYKKWRSAKIKTCPPYQRHFVYILLAACPIILQLFYIKHN